MKKLLEENKGLIITILTALVTLIGGGSGYAMHRHHRHHEPQAQEQKATPAKGEYLREKYEHQKGNR